jgi:hypothetical protein
MNQTPDYEITPANQNCSNIQNKPTIQLTSGTPTANASSKIDDFHTQHQENIKYDSIGDPSDMKPLTGGRLSHSPYSGKNNKLNLYAISFLKKNYKIFSKSQDDAIYTFINKKNFKKDNLLEISCINTKNNNDSSLYVILSNSNNKSNKFKKLYV